MPINGGDFQSYGTEPRVDTVQVLLVTDGEPLDARVELVRGSDMVVQVVDISTEDGLDLPFLAFFETPGSDYHVRVVNNGPLESMLSASVEPYYSSVPRVNRGRSSFPGRGRRGGFFGRGGDRYMGFGRGGERYMDHGRGMGRGERYMGRGRDYYDRGRGYLGRGGDYGRGMGRGMGRGERYTGRGRSYFDRGRSYMGSERYMGRGREYDRYGMGGRYGMGDYDGYQTPYGYEQADRRRIGGVGRSTTSTPMGRMRYPPRGGMDPYY
jgi:hypothetical protein